MDAPPNLGLRRALAALAGAAGGTLAGGLASALLLCLHAATDEKYVLNLRQEVTGRFFYCLLFWLVVASGFSALRAFGPTDARAEVRALLWFGLFLPLASLGSWFTFSWIQDAFHTGPSWPAALIAKLARRPWTRQDVIEFVGVSFRAVLPLAVVGLAAGAPVRAQLAACAATGLAWALVFLKFTFDPDAFDIGLGLVPVVAFAGGLGLTRLLVRDPEA